MKPLIKFELNLLPQPIAIINGSKDVAITARHDSTCTFHWSCGKYKRVSLAHNVIHTWVYLLDIGVIVLLLGLFTELSGN